MALLHVQKNSLDERRLVAVIGVGGNGIFFKEEVGNGIRFLSSSTRKLEACSKPGDLSSLLREDTGRTPVYEGESITITF